jgi:hypothetical protein
MNIFNEKHSTRRYLGSFYFTTFDTTDDLPCNLKLILLSFVVYIERKFELVFLIII